MSPAFIFVASALMQTPPAKVFMSPQAFAETHRLAMTPVLDGKIDVEEWDPLYSDTNFQSYFQWSPEQLHIAGKLPIGQDFVLSFDGGANGWLQGDDNLEVRISMRDGKPVVKCRMLYTTGLQGPRWIDGSAFDKASEVVAIAKDNQWSFECTLSDPASNIIPSSPRKVAARVDMVPTESVVAEPFYPRALSPLEFTFERAAGLPVGVTWKTETNPLRSVIAGRSIRIHHSFSGLLKAKMSRVDMRSEGPVKDLTTVIGFPFPLPDKKGDVGIDYDTAVRADAPQGWYVQRTAVTAADGITSLVQTSYRVAPLLDVDLSHDVVALKENQKTERFNVWIQSHSENRVDGVMNLSLPEGWKAVKGNSDKFVAYHSRGKVKLPIEIAIPEKTAGSFPIKVDVSVGKAPIQKTLWVTVQPK